MKTSALNLFVFRKGQGQDRMEDRRVVEQNGRTGLGNGSGFGVGVGVGLGLGWNGVGLEPPTAKPRAHGGGVWRKTWHGVTKTPNNLSSSAPFCRHRA